MNKGAKTMYLLYTLIAILLILPEIPHLLSYASTISTGTSSLLGVQALFCALVVIAPLPAPGGWVWVCLRRLGGLMGAVARLTFRLPALWNAKKTDTGIRITTTPIPIIRSPALVVNVNTNVNGNASCAGLVRGAQGNSYYTSTAGTPGPRDYQHQHHRPQGPSTYTYHRSSSSYTPYLTTSTSSFSASTSGPSTTGQRQRVDISGQSGLSPASTPIPAHYSYTTSHHRSSTRPPAQQITSQPTHPARATPPQQQQQQRIYLTPDFYSTTHIYAALSQRLLLTQYTYHPAYERQHPRWGGGPCGAGCAPYGYGKCTHTHAQQTEKEKAQKKKLGAGGVLNAHYGNGGGGGRVVKGRRTSPVPNERQKRVRGMEVQEGMEGWDELDRKGKVDPGGEVNSAVVSGALDAGSSTAGIGVGSGEGIEGDLMELDTPPSAVECKEKENIWESAWRVVKSAARERLRRPPPQAAAPNVTRTPASKKVGRTAVVQKTKTGVGSGLFVERVVAGSGRVQAHACVDGRIVKAKPGVKPCVKKRGGGKSNDKRRGTEGKMELEEEMEMEKENRPVMAPIPAPAPAPIPVPVLIPLHHPPSKPSQRPPAPAPAPAPAPPPPPPPPPLPPPRPTTPQPVMVLDPVLEAEPDAGYDSFDDEYNSSVAAERSSLVEPAAPRHHPPTSAPLLASLLNPAPIAPLPVQSTPPMVQSTPSTVTRMKIARWLDPLPDEPVAKKTAPVVTMTKLPPAGPGGIAVRRTKVGPEAMKAIVQARQKRLDRDDPDR